jgi:hypothetical protein
MKATGRLVGALAMIVTAALAWPMVAGAQDQTRETRAGRVSDLKGSVMVARATATEASPLNRFDDVFLRDRITTGDQSIAKILLGGRAVVTAREHSVLVITETPTTSTITLTSGRLFVNVDKERMNGMRLEVRMPNAIAGVRGTLFVAETETLPSGEVVSKITTLRGLVDVTQIDATGRPLGPLALVNPLQFVGVKKTIGGVQILTPAQAKQLADEFHMDPPAVTGTSPLGDADMAQAKAAAAASNKPGFRTLDGTTLNERAPILPSGIDAFRPRPGSPSTTSTPCTHCGD